MFFFKGKEDMGLAASLNLLDLSPAATIDDANQAYTYLHRMIDLFHRDNDEPGGERQKDLELLACAYEKAVSYLSDPRTVAQESSSLVSEEAGDDAPPTTDLHFTINFANAEKKNAPIDDGPSLHASENDTVENAIAIIFRRLQEAETALEEAREAVVAATTALDSANQRLEKAKDVKMNAMLAAKSAESKAKLMEIEAKRATEEAIAVAEKVRDRVKSANQAAKQAKIEADQAQQKIRQIASLEETAAAEAVCAEDRLEKAKQHFKTLTHTVVAARSQLRMFEQYDGQARGAAAPGGSDQPESLSAESVVTEYQMDTQEQILSDLIDIETSLDTMPQEARPTVSDHDAMDVTNDQKEERRQHERLSYPTEERPMFSFGGRRIPIFNLSQRGMGLDADAMLGQSHPVRGAIVFKGAPAMDITGRVVRQDEMGLGLRLVTRIGNHILDRERMRLSA